VNTNIVKQNKDFLAVLVVTAAILLLPLVAMRYTDEVNWTLGDFIFASVLLGGTGTLLVLVKRMANTTAYRAAAVIALVATFLLIWVNGAVGIIGDGPINMLYLGVVAVEFLGACLVGFKARGMMWSLVATALATFLIPIIALIVQTPDFSPGVWQVFGLNGFFVILYAGSALLFRQAVTKV
jgi:hypothetical protein